MKDWSEIIKNLVTAAAIVLGGIWALIEFNTLLEATRAEQEAEVARRELAEAEILSLRVEAQASVLAEGGYRIDGHVRIENVGTVRAEIPLDEDRGRMDVVQLVPANGQAVAIDRTSFTFRDHRGPVETVLVLPTRTVSLPFAFWVDSPGLYLLVCEIDVPPGLDAAADGGTARSIWQQMALVDVRAPASE